MDNETNKVVVADEPESARSKLPALPKKGNSPFSKLASLDPKAFATPPNLAEQAKADPQTAAPETQAEEGRAVEPPKPDTASVQPEASKAAVTPARAPSRPAKPAKSVKPKITGEMMVLQTSVPLELAIAFKTICARSRSSVREELEKMVQARVDKEG